MPVYHFSLTLAGVTPATPNLEQHLFEQGCEDALICAYNQTVYLEFDREADDFSSALLSAVRDCEAAPLRASVVAADADLVGLSDIAELTGMTRQAIALLKEGKRGTGNFPSPVQRLKGASPLWRWAEVAAWLAEQQRLPPEMADNARQLAALNLALQLRAKEQRAAARHWALQLAALPHTA
ncbi:DNA-binding protein [Chimaeribacter californicus]|uniref:DNA-binding protein n=1 Tax=Chimaeribacter californicus TaxID=2060067 RepID=A0A2N5E744_9GAMM|nr:DNA-binding protein [Chimaeribacter californicus]PLR37298.1 DNA-binding protein [Chimaeribacter californicus]